MSNNDDFISDEEDDDNQWINSILSESEDEEEEVMVLFFAAGGNSTRVKKFYVRNRLEWDAHCRELLEEGEETFARMYRMNVNSFEVLCNLIRKDIEVD